MDTPRTQVSTLRIAQSPMRMLVVTACIAFTAALAQTAIAQPAGGPGTGPQGGHGMGMMDHGGPGMGHHGKYGKRMDGERGMTRLLDMVGASPEQRAKIKAISDTARTDMRAQREAGRALREQSRAILAQPTIDANAAEALRQQQLAHHDQASRRMLQMKLDIANVLTPEQRKTLADRMAQRGAMMERHRAERGAVAGQPAR